MSYILTPPAQPQGVINATKVWATLRWTYNSILVTICLSKLKILIALYKKVGQNIGQKGRRVIQLLDAPKDLSYGGINNEIWRHFLCHLLNVDAEAGV